MTISKFLSSSSAMFIDPKISPSLLACLVEDFGIPEDTLEFMGVIKKEYNMFTETSFLYKFPKDSKKLGNYIKHLGTLINRLPLPDGSDFGIQELDTARPDGYYILFYLLEGVRE